MWSRQQQYCAACAAIVLLGFLALCLYLDPSTRAVLNPFGKDECSQYEQQQSQTYQGRSEQKPLPNPSGETNMKADTTKEPRDNVNHQAVQADYYACRLAVYTRQLALFTALLAGATTILIAVGVYQASHLKKSVDVAASAAEEAKDAIKAIKSSAVAAEEANKINRELLITSQRPWVSIEPAPEITTSLVFDEIGATVTIKFTVKNVGRAQLCTHGLSHDRYCEGWIRMKSHNKSFARW
jgi:hypothetical protein